MAGRGGAGGAGRGGTGGSAAGTTGTGGTTVSNLPDPFLMINGTRISTKDQWRCRRAEIKALMEHWVSGPKGAPPAASSVTATLSGSSLRVVVSQTGTARSRSSSG
jgi:hypothetical protein